MSLMATASETPSAGTSKTYPCGMPLRVVVVSSALSQVPQGVTPPAQLRTVPVRLPYALTSSPASGSNTRFVLPPPEPGLYVAWGPANRAPLVRSWLRTRVIRSLPVRKAPMPSCTPGVVVPSSIGSPVHPKLRYSKPRGSLSSSRPVVWSRTGASGP
jgi:hypothetical protein